MTTIETLDKQVSIIQRQYQFLRIDYAKNGIYTCEECGEILTPDEVEEARENKLNMLEVNCDKCDEKLIVENRYANMNPDERS